MVQFIYLSIHFAAYTLLHSHTAPTTQRHTHATTCTHHLPHWRTPLVAPHHTLHTARAHAPPRHTGLPTTTCASHTLPHYTTSPAHAPAGTLTHHHTPPLHSPTGWFDTLHTYSLPYAYDTSHFLLTRIYLSGTRAARHIAADNRLPGFICLCAIFYRPSADAANVFLALATILALASSHFSLIFSANTCCATTPAYRTALWRHKQPEQAFFSFRLPKPIPPWRIS